MAAPMTDPINPNETEPASSARTPHRLADHLGRPGSPGGRGRLRIPGRRDHAGLRRPAAVPDPPHPGAARAGRRAHGRRLRARLGQGRRVRRDLGPRRDQPGDRHRQRDDGFDSDGLHHRPGPLDADRQRRLPGDRHHRRHAADHQAQLPGHARPRTSCRPSARRSTSRARAARARCWSTSPRTRRTQSIDYQLRRVAGAPAGLPPRAPPAARRARGSGRDDPGRQAPDHLLRPRHHQGQRDRACCSSSCTRRTSRWR